MTDVEGLELSPEDADLLKHPSVGGVILFSRNYADPEQLKALVGQIRQLRSPPLLIAVDQEGGRVQRFTDGFTRLPPLRWIGQRYDIDEAEARRFAHTAGWIMAAELRSVGVDFSFAPVVDLDWGLSEVIGDRSFHSSPEVVSTLALSYIQGMRSAGMAAVAKHFPGHGGVVADSHVALPEDHRPYAELIEDLKPYRSLIDHGLQGIMSAHVRYTEIDEQIASMSKYWLQSELRQGLGFGGSIFSDDLSMAGARIAGTVQDRCVAALEVGSDMILICNDRDAAVAAVEQLADASQPVSQARLVAMRSRQPDDENASVGSPVWQDAVDTLQAAVEQPPPLELDG